MAGLSDRCGEVEEEELRPGLEGLWTKGELEENRTEEGGIPRGYQL